MSKVLISRMKHSIKRNLNRLVGGPLLVTLCLSAGVPNNVLAQSSDAVPEFVVTDFVVEGKNPLSKRQTNRILEPYKNRSLTIEELRQASTELEKALAVEGHNFYRASLPPQRLENNTVTLEIDRIEIDNVTVTGNTFFSNENVQRSLPLVAKGESPNTQRIASALLLAEDNPAKDIRVVFIKGDEPQTVDANLSVTDQNPNELYLWANNAGSRLTTDSRLGIQYHNRNLWGRDHQMALSYTTSPEDPSEISQYGINYRVPVYSTRGMINGFYSRSDADTGRVADVFDVSGAGKTIGLGYTQYLHKRDKYQHRLKVGVTDKLFDSDILFDQQNIGSDVRSRPAIIEYVSRLDVSNWLFNSIISHSTNLSGGSFNDDASYAAARAGADSDWSKQELSLRIDTRWDQRWRSKFVIFGQSTSDALIPGEKFGLGGALGDYGPRGFYEREVVVDEGIKASIEVTHDFTVQKMLLGVFYDYATGDQINPQAGESAKETLSSVGISYRWNIRPDVSLNIDYGYVLDGIDQTFSNGTDDGDSRVHLSLRYYPRWPFGGEK